MFISVKHNIPSRSNLNNASGMGARIESCKAFRMWTGKDLGYCMSLVNKPNEELVIRVNLDTSNESILRVVLSAVRDDFRNISGQLPGVTFSIRRITQ